MLGPCAADAFRSGSVEVMDRHVRPAPILSLAVVESPVRVEAGQRPHARYIADGDLPIQVRADSFCRCGTARKATDQQGR